MKAIQASLKILALCFLFLAATKMPTVAQSPIPTKPYFKTHFQDESQFIVETIASDLAEEIYYAKHRRLPDTRPFSVETSHKEGLGPRFTYPAPLDTPIYEITIAYETNRPNLRAELEVIGPIWSPETYAGLGTLLVKDIGLSVMDSQQSPQGDLRLLSALTDATAITIEAEDQRLSKALELNFTNSFLHEQAAVLLGVFAMREHSGHFSDVRLPLCRMTAHLCMARLLSGQRPPGVNGRIAEAMLFALMNNQVTSLEKLASLDTSDPTISKWSRTLHAFITKDYRQFTNSPAALPIEKIARFDAFATSVSADLAWNQLSPNDKMIPDFARIVKARGYTVETGHELLQVSVAVELKEIATVYDQCHARRLTAANLVQELNAIPERCITRNTNGTFHIAVLGWGQWASFFQRHLCEAAVEGFYFMNKMWSVPEEAADYAAACNTNFGGLRLYPFVRRYQCTDATALPAIVAAGRKIYTATPQLVPVECWEQLLTAFGGIGYVNQVELQEWLARGSPPGTAFDGGQHIRQFRSGSKEWFNVHEVAPYDRAISLMIYMKIYQKSPTYQQAEALFHSVLPYATYAMSRVADTVKDHPDRYEELMAKACQLNPSLYLSLGDYCAERLLDDKAEGYYSKGDQLGPDSLAAASVASWRVKYYLKKNQKENARRIADAAGEVYSYLGLLAKAEFLEATGQYSDAYDWYSKIEERYGDPSDPAGFFIRYKAKTGDSRFVNEYNKRIKDVFPNGIEPATLKDFSAAPRDGVLFIANSELLRRAGLQAGNVIVAIDGIRVHNVPQYYYRCAASQAPEMVLIVWQGNAYKEIRASPPNHRFGVAISNYVK